MTNKIETEVILSAKESIFEEDTLQQFEVFGITTSFDEWYKEIAKNIDESFTAYKPTYFLDECLAFAKRQYAYMLKPTAIFGKTTYIAKNKKFNHIEDIVIDGPLYIIFASLDDDTEKEKTVERRYIDPVSLEPKIGLWYPNKVVYFVRYGVSFV